jgi:hypothetical protein
MILRKGISFLNHKTSGFPSPLPPKPKKREIIQIHTRKKPIGLSKTKVTKFLPKKITNRFFFPFSIQKKSGEISPEKEKTNQSNLH